MKLEKAIEILKGFEEGMAIPYGQDTKDAVQLGIEALKRLREHRTILIDINYRALPGETEE